MSPPPSGPGSSMRVSPNRYQVATANQTLNTILGRGTKSWMHNSPCDEAAQSTGRGIVSSSVRSRRPAQPPPQTGNNSQAPQQPPQNPTNDGSVLPSPALTNEPSPAASTCRASPNTTSTEAQTTNQEQTAYSTACFEPALALCRDEARVSTLSMPEQPDSLAQPSSSSGASNLIIAPVGVEASSSSLDLQTRTATAADVQNNGATRHVKRTREPAGLNPTALPPSPKRPRLAPNPRNANTSPARDLTAQMGHLALVVQQRILSLGGLGNLKKDVERARYKFLQDACSRRDHFYAVLHQLFCLWSLQNPVIYQILMPMDQKSVNKAFNLLSQFLRPNTTIQTDHLSWFAASPMPSEGNLTLAPLFHSCVSDVILFLTALADHWRHLLTSVQQRQYPITANELIQVLRCPSPILRGILYTVSRRSLAIPDSVANDLNNLFLRDESIEVSSRAGQTEGRGMVSSRHELAAQYRSLVLEAQRTAAQLGVNRDSPSRAGFPTSIIQDGINQGPPATARHSPQLPSAPATSPRHNAPTFMPEPPSAGSVYSRPRLPMPQTQRGSIHLPRLPNQQPTSMQHQEGRGNIPTPQSSPWANGVEGFQQAPVLLSQVPPGFHPHHTHLAHRHRVCSGQFDATHGNQFGAQVQPGTTHASYFPPQPHYAAGDYMAGLPVPPRHPGQGLQTNPAQGRFPQTMQQNRNAHAPASGHQNSPALAHPHMQTSPSPAQRQVGRRQQVRIIRENEFPMSPHGWTSVEVSAHLPQLRSPKRIPAQRGSGRYLQYVCKYIVKPTRIDPGDGIRTLEFTLSAEDLSRIPTKGYMPLGLPARYHFEGSCRYRLRCCVRSKQQTTVHDSDWAVSDTAWPNEIYIFCNDRALGVSRKQHFSRDLPLELTDSLVEGKNVVKISIPGNRCNLGADSTFYLAVEAVVTVGHSVLKKHINTATHVTSDRTKAEIARRLQPAESDDVIVEGASLDISLADPFSSVMFQVPVRGADCKHLECFDLQNWLATRPGKSKGDIDLSIADCWKCPICGRDARPNQLYVDDFLVEVRASLLLAGKGGTKRIQVTADGNWTAVPEPDETDDEDPEHAPPHQPPPEVSWASRTSVPPTVIEILDD